MKLILSITAAFALALGVLTACQSAAKPVKVEKAVGNMNAAPPKTDEHGHTDDAPRISLADAKKDFDAGVAVFVDTRAESAYKQEHIKGAINLPMEAFATDYKKVPTDKKIIAYCS